MFTPRNAMLMWLSMIAMVLSVAPHGWAQGTRRTLIYADEAGAPQGEAATSSSTKRRAAASPPDINKGVWMLTVLPTAQNPHYLGHTVLAIDGTVVGYEPRSQLELVARGYSPGRLNQFQSSGVRGRGATQYANGREILDGFDVTANRIPGANGAAMLAKASQIQRSLKNAAPGFVPGLNDCVQNARAILEAGVPGSYSQAGKKAQLPESFRQQVVKAGIGEASIDVGPSASRTSSRTKAKPAPASAPTAPATGARKSK